jgi:hypothetical protein
MTDYVSKPLNLQDLKRVIEIVTERTQTPLVGNG